MSSAIVPTATTYMTFLLVCPFCLSEEIGPHDCEDTIRLAEVMKNAIAKQEK